MRGGNVDMQNFESFLFLFSGFGFGYFINGKGCHYVRQSREKEGLYTMQGG